MPSLGRSELETADAKTMEALLEAEMPGMNEFMRQFEEGVEGDLLKQLEATMAQLGTDPELQRQLRELAGALGEDNPFAGGMPSMVRPAAAAAGSTTTPATKAPAAAAGPSKPATFEETVSSTASQLRQSKEEVRCFGQSHSLFAHFLRGSRLPQQTAATTPC